MLFQAVVALIPATIIYEPQSSLNAGTHEAERYVSNIMDVRKAAPCVYYLLKNSDSNLVTVRNVVFYVDQQISVSEFAECE